MAKDLDKPGAHNYESGGRRFESFRARQLANCWHELFCPLCRRAASTPGAPWKRGGSRNGLCTSIRIVAVGGIGWGQAVSGLYARGHGSCDVEREGKLEIVCPLVDAYRWHLQGCATSQCHQALSHTIPQGGAADVPPPEGFQPLASYKIANNYREFMNPTSWSPIRASAFRATRARRPKGGVR
jgi:hypothetical protein